ncbi:MAG TPA: methyltransferase domain-containing protein, partial [Spirochaetes bacterium]|nr:methyltransferase domain-containing protein [Spirochaetota bacterium]
MNINQTPTKLRLLNLACGAKVSTVGDWINIDFSSPYKDVINMDILKGLHFPDNRFDAVYTAQFVEHLTIKEAESVLVEILRVLKPGGILRIVTPDMEELAQSYLQYLRKLKVGKDPFDEKRYDWIRIELFDQIVRDCSGGEMTTVLSQCDEQMKGYLSERIGYSFAS